MEDGDFRRRPPLWTSYFSPEEVCFLTTVHTLASGSSGNALLLSCGESYILLDAGISCRRITAALRELGLELGSLTAILITHTHADHISGLQTLLKRCAAPVFTTERAARELSWRLPGAETRLDALDFGIPQSIGEFAVTAFPTSHDAPGSCGFRLDAAGGAVGVLTDTGYVTDETADILEGVDLAVLEANHDIETLRSGPYPYYLRARIESVRGHLSNDECSAKLLELIQEGCKKFALCHLSQENNTPALALQTVFNTLGAAGVVPEKDCIVQAQRRNEMSPVLEF